MIMIISIISIVSISICIITDIINDTGNVLGSEWCKYKRTLIAMPMTNPMNMLMRIANVIVWHVSIIVALAAQHNYVY